MASRFAAAVVVAESPFDAPALTSGQVPPLELDEPEAPPTTTTTTTTTTSLASSTEEPPPAALGALLEPVLPAWPPASSETPGAAPRSRGKLLAAAAVAVAVIVVVIAGATLALTGGEPVPTIVAVVEPPPPVVEPSVVEPPVVEPPVPVEPPPPVVEPTPPVEPPPPVVEPPPPAPDPVMASDVQVTFASIPAGAAVFVGAEAIGVTPLTRPMPASKAATRITFRHDGYLPATKQVVLKEGTRVGVVLSPARAATKPVVEKKPTPPADGTLKEGALVNPFKKKKK